MLNVRAAALTNFEIVSRFLGVDPAPLLAAAGFDAAVTEDPDRPLPASKVAGLLEEVARASDCTHFGLLMAESRSLASIGPVSLVLMHQARVRDVVQAMVRYQHLFGHAIHIVVETVGEAMLVRVEIAGVPLARQGNELFVAYFCRCIAAVLGRPWSPESVHFIHARPADLSVHRRVFGCPVAFESEFNGIVCARDAMQEETPAGDEALADHAERLLASILPQSDAPGVADRARRFLRLLLPGQRGTIGEVAPNMGLSPRSLQRALGREGHSFGGLLDEVRRELATRYLAASHPVATVAGLAGFAGASAFTRWFTGAFGVPPAQWRRDHADGERRG
jgi:AraC-like DNA-binding protein